MHIYFHPQIVGVRNGFFLFLGFSFKANRFFIPLMQHCNQKKTSKKITEKGLINKPGKIWQGKNCKKNNQSVKPIELLLEKKHPHNSMNFNQVSTYHTTFIQKQSFWFFHLKVSKKEEEEA